MDRLLAIGIRAIMMGNIFVSIAATMVFSATTLAGGGALTGGATEFTQVLNNSELAAQVSQQIKTYQSLKLQLEVVRNNDRLLNSHHFSNVAPQLLSTLHQAMVTDRTVSYHASSVAEEFQRKYPSYRQYARDTYGVEPPTNASFLAWDNQNQANLQAALETINLNRDQVLTEGQMLDLVARQADNTESKKAILQLGNDLALTQLHQARRMENLLQTQIALQANYLAAEQGKQVREEAASEDNWQKEKEWMDNFKKQYDAKPWRIPRE